ncbi:MAG: SpoIIE family protein phosphatase [candidate division Zixibacteria bacterium]
MTVADLEHFKKVLLLRVSSLDSLLESSNSPTEQDTPKVQSLLKEIKEALGRVEDRSFGQCNLCDGEVEYHRLEVQPAAEICLDCISEKEKVLLEEELFLASKIHRALLPQSVEKIEGYDIKAISLSARTVGGDYYDILSGKGDSARIIIADAMGKGIPAGLIMSNLQGALRVLSEEIESPSKLLASLNRWLCHNVQVTNFISLACVSLNHGLSDESPITYSNAGHCPPILFRNNGDIESLEPTGGVIGVHEDFAYEEQLLTISTGDLLLLYTDGVTEAVNKSGEMFGEERLIKYIKEESAGSAEAFLDGLLNSIRAFSGGEELSDDLTAVAIRKTI